MKKSYIIYAMTLSFGFLSQNALSEIILNKGTSVQGINSSSQSVVIQVGTMDKELKIINGFAKDLPLVEVLKQIVPVGWTVKKAGNVNTHQRTSWSGGKDWVGVMTEVSDNAGVDFKINWTTREVTILEKGMAGSMNTFKVVTGELAIKNYRDVTTWNLEPGISLKENLEKWTKKIGWDLVWVGEDYPIDVGVTFSGSLDDDNGPLSAIAEAYQTAKQPLTFTLKLQNTPPTLVVKNMEYEQHFFANEIVK